MTSLTTFYPTRVTFDLGTPAGDRAIPCKGEGGGGSSLVAKELAKSVPMVRPAKAAPPEAGAAKRLKTMDQIPLASNQATGNANSTSEGRRPHPRRPHPEKYEVNYPSYTAVTPSGLRSRWAQGPPKPVFLFYDDRLVSNNLSRVMCSRPMCVVLTCVSRSVRPVFLLNPCATA